jgi:hypothetical protein
MARVGTWRAQRLETPFSPISRFPLLWIVLPATAGFHICGLTASSYTRCPDTSAAVLVCVMASCHDPGWRSGTGQRNPAASHWCEQQAFLSGQTACMGPDYPASTYVQQRSTCGYAERHRDNHDQVGTTGEGGKTDIRGHSRVHRPIQPNHIVVRFSKICDGVVGVTRKDGEGWEQLARILG